MNGSPSTVSPDWPTRWPKDSFRSVWSWLLVGLFVAGIVAATVFTLQSAPKLQTLKVTPGTTTLFDVGIVAQAVLEGLLVAAVLAVLPRLAKFSLRELGFRRPDRRTLVIALLGALAMTVVANGLASLIDTFLHSKHQQDIVEIVKDLHDPLSLAILSTYAVVLAPFFEEALFRVFLFNVGLRYAGFWGGAIFSAVLFGVVHADVYAAIPLALGGGILCYVYYRSRNAWASMISHGIFNGVSILALLVAPGLTN